MIYTLIITGPADGHQHHTPVEFRDDATAIADARSALTAEHSSIAVARGAASDIIFLGVWDWTDGLAKWTPDE